MTRPSPSVYFSPTSAVGLTHTPFPLLLPQHTIRLFLSTFSFTTPPILSFDSPTTLIMARKRSGRNKDKGKASANDAAPGPSTPSRPRDTQASSATRGGLSGSAPRSNASSAVSRSSSRARLLAMSPSRGGHMSPGSRRMFPAAPPSGVNAAL